MPDKKVGGGQIAALRLAGALARDHEVSVIFACPEISDDTPPAIPPGVQEIESIPGHIRHYFPRPLWLLITVLDFILPPWLWSRESGVLVNYLEKRYQKNRRRHFLKMVNEDDFDIINSHVWRSDYFVGECKPKHWKTPWVITMHGCYELLLSNMARHPFDEQKIKKVLNLADQILFVAKKNLTVFTSLPDFQPKNEPVQVFNGIEPMQVSGSPPPRFERGDADLLLTLVSRPIAEKGWLEAISAVQELNSETEYNVKLILVGSSPYQEELERKYQDRMIIFYGHSPDPMSIINECDFGILPSYFPSESYPLSVIEYLSCGKPVLATDIGEIRVMLEYRGQLAGQLLPKSPDGKADIEGIKIAILNYLHDPKLLESHASQAYLAAEKFSMHGSLLRYEKVFESCMREIV
ncbi:glycosyltransferase family 4 protein [Pseudomonadota bacterium]